jgi:hypothetical protein
LPAGGRWWETFGCWVVGLVAAETQIPLAGASNERLDEHRRKRYQTAPHRVLSDRRRMALLYVPRFLFVERKPSLGTA